jgi:hypothetical protein
VNLLQGKELKDDLPENVRLEDKTLIFGWRQEITNDNVEELYDKHIQERGIAPYLDAYWEYDEVTSNWFE